MTKDIEKKLGRYNALKLLITETELDYIKSNKDKDVGRALAMLKREKRGLDKILNDIPNSKRERDLIRFVIIEKNSKIDASIKFNMDRSTVYRRINGALDRFTL
ncbi:MAG: hypothetical protein ACRC7N_04030 [Clostridium sp.]